ncbi:MAG TPA: NAD-dependent malic enzyme [Bryobacteraceae bacterium]|nr:NAD-dependent malic enzyme [Bryobacteraceae bacterium]
MSFQPLSPILRGIHLLSVPAWNKGTAFTEEERSRFGLHGLLPPYAETLDEQVERAYKSYLVYEKEMNRHIYLRQLQDNNEVLFYRLLADHIEEMTPIVYTPTVAEACRHFSHIYRRPRGLFISYPLRDSIHSLLRNRFSEQVDVIVVTDGERILGIGDQGVGGLGIPIGKLSLYSLIGGIHPARTLPIVLDVGTNNEESLRDHAYLGWRHERIRGPAYDEFIDKFVQAVKLELPNTLLQWEDFATPHARPILDRYRDKLLTFNDDIQGTAAVALGAILSAIKVAGKTLRDQKIVFLGAGSAAIGVADYLRDAMIAAGLTRAEALDRIWIVNRGGVLRKDRTDLTAEQRVYARLMTEAWDFAEVIRRIDATILIGLSTSRGAFTEPIVREMARKVERPVIFPLSNPTEKSEATAEDVIRWTDGRALVASGSPFTPVEFGGRTIPIAQCNNVYIFPAVGLGVVASRATRVTDAMMQAAARALAEHSPALKDPEGRLLPRLQDLRAVAKEIALAVGLEAQRSGHAAVTSPEGLRETIDAIYWNPQYPEY